MHLESIDLIQFKNHLKTSLKFSTQLNCFMGLNGSGKTNILDSIHYLSLTKSAVQSSDTLNISHSQDFFCHQREVSDRGKIPGSPLYLRGRQEKADLPKRKSTGQNQ
ncbi:AAA family ATPase [Algoriphagus boritolerans]|uniref:AAA family ATPase n=1 Tax=Algoriphagus boritolerans TaxID=308111 RepID=UPI000A68FE88